MPQNLIPRKKITIRLRQSVYSKLSEYAKSHGVKVTSEAIKAVELYLENAQREHDAAWQSPLEHRMQKLENRLATLWLSW